MHTVIEWVAWMYYVDNWMVTRVMIKLLLGLITNQESIEDTAWVTQGKSKTVSNIDGHWEAAEKSSTTDNNKDMNAKI